MRVVEIEDAEIPESMQRAMAREAEAERERRAKVINARGELQAPESCTKPRRPCRSEFDRRLPPAGRRGVLAAITNYQARPILSLFNRRQVRPRRRLTQDESKMNRG